MRWSQRAGGVAAAVVCGVVCSAVGVMLVSCEAVRFVGRWCGLVWWRSCLVVVVVASALRGCGLVGVVCWRRGRVALFVAPRCRREASVLRGCGLPAAGGAGFGAGVCLVGL